MRPTALFISVVFHPVFVNLLSLWLLFRLNPNVHYGINPVIQWYYLSLVFITTSLFPVLWVMLARLFGRVTSFYMEQREERNLPYLLTACAFLFDYYIAREAGLAAGFVSWLLACSCVSTVMLILNQFIKVSIHAAALGALCGMLLAQAGISDAELRLYLVAAVLLSGLVMTARMVLDAHTPFQLYLGFGAGLLLMWGMVH